MYIYIYIYIYIYTYIYVCIYIFCGRKKTNKQACFVVAVQQLK